jgi:hypothetical protein
MPSHDVFENKAVPNPNEPHSTANRLALMFLKLKAKPCHTIPDRVIRYLTLP